MNHHAAMLIIDPVDGTILDANPAAAALYGWPRKTLLGMRMTEINTLPPNEVREALTEAAGGGQSRFRFRHRTATGDIRDVEVFAGPVRLGGRDLLMSVIHDQTIERRGERALSRMTDLYDMLSQANKLIARAETQEELFDGVCAIANRHGGFLLTWIGIADDSGAVTVVARAGEDGGYLDAVEANVPRGDLARGPVVRAMQSGHPIVHNEFSTMAVGDPWRALTAGMHVGSMAAFPFRGDVQVSGAIVLYASEQHFFDEAVISTLHDLVLDISFGLDRLAGDAKRKALIESLEVAEARLRYALEGAGQGVWEWNVPTGEMFYSEIGLRTFGYTPSAIAPDYGEWISRVHPDDLASVTAAMHRHFRGEDESYRTEHRVRRADGSYGWVSARGRVLTRAADGSPILFIGTHTDVSARKEAEIALQKSETRLKEAERIAHLGNWELDPATMTGVWSAEAYRILGVDPSQTPVDAATFMRAIQRDDRRRMETWLAALIRGETPAAIEFRAIHPDGMVRHVEGDGELLHDADHPNGYVVGTVLDITERVRTNAERQLQSAALNAMANSMVITDREGTIVWANPAFTRQTGYAAGEIEGMNPRDLIKSGEQDDTFYARLWTTVLSGQVWHGELTNRRKDGTKYPEEMTITPVRDATGEVTHFIAVKRDLTEQKRLQAEYLQAQKMEGVGRLAAGIAHDFNNMLTVINNTAELAARALDPGVALAEDLAEIRAAGDRAAGLTRKLLAFSRKQLLKPENLTLDTLAAGIEPMLRRVVVEDIDIAVLPARDLWSVRADPGQIEQVILNLVLNARDAMPTGGTITIETRNVELDEAFAAEHEAAEAGQYVALIVTDTGTGIPESIRENIFDPFFTTKEAGKGTGLGLATVHGIVRQSGGVITVSSKPGQGAAFTIHLPRVEASPAAVTARPADKPTTGTETILVVEDDMPVRRLTSRVLEAAGYTVLTAANGADALQVLARSSNPIHLVLTDVVMPGMSGQKLAEHISRDRSGVKVLFTSGYTDDDILRRGVVHHSARLLGKPYTVRELTDAVREALDAES